VPSEQIPSNVLKDKSPKIAAGLKTEKEMLLSAKITISALPYHAIANHLKAMTSENSAIAHATSKKEKLRTPLKTLNTELIHKLTRQSVTFSAM
jgi:hypothetical protein